MDNLASKLAKIKYLYVILSVSVLLRIAAALYLGNTVEILPGTFDQISYHNLAVRVIDGHGFSFGELWWPITAPDAPTAHWSFLYTLYLSGVYLIFGVNPLVARLIQAVISGLLFPLLTYKLGQIIFNEKIALVAAGICAVYLYFIYYAGALMTESFYIIALLASFYNAIRLTQLPETILNRFQTPKTPRYLIRTNHFRYGVALGISLGCAALLRQLSLLFFPFLLAWVWWAGGRSRRGWMVTMIGVTVLIIGLLVLPFTIYNYARFDRFVLLNTNAGYAFYWGNHPIYGAKFESILPAELGTYQDLIPSELYALDEAALDQELLKRGLKFIVDDPRRYILLSISRIPAYFKFWPSADSDFVSNVSRVLSFGISWPFMVIGLVVATINKYSRHKFNLRSPMTLLLIFVFIYTLIHILTWALIRYRLPVDAVLMLFEAVAFVYIGEFILRKKDSIQQTL